METVRIVAEQTLIMFLLIGTGYVLFRKGKLSLAGSRDMASLMVTIIIPAVIVNSLAVEYTAEKAKTLLLCSALSAVLLAVSLVISHLILKENPIDDFASGFSNPGFFGIPLVQAAFGNDAVFYIAPFIVGINILQFSYGVRLMGRTSSSDWRHYARNPIFLSAVIGLILFFIPVSPPSPVSSALNYIAGLNAPIAMIVMGGYLAQTDFLSLFTSARLYALCFCRLFLIPAVSLLVISLFPADMQIRSALLIAASCPVGANVAAYAQLNGHDYAYAVKTVVLSTLLSNVFLPAVQTVARFIWN